MFCVADWLYSNLKDAKIFLLFWFWSDGFIQIAASVERSLVSEVFKPERGFVWKLSTQATVHRCDCLLVSWLRNLAADLLFSAQLRQALERQ